MLAATQPLAWVMGMFSLFAAAYAAILTPTAVLLAVLILAPLRTLIATESQWPLPLDIGQIGILFTLGTVVIHRIAAQKRLFPTQWSPLYVSLSIFILVTGLTGFSATSLAIWLNEWLKWILIGAMIVLALSLGQWRWLLFGLVVAGVANALVGLYIYFGGSGADHLFIGNGTFRAFGTFGQPNPYGGFMGLIAPLAVMQCYGWSLRLIEHRKRGWSWQMVIIWAFYTAAAFIIIAGLFASWSRGAWLAFVVSIAVLAFALPQKTWKSLLAAAVIAAAVILLWFSGRLPQSVVQRIASSTEEFFAFDDMRGVDITPENYAVVERLAHWQAALNMLQDHPWLGVGFGHYEIAYDRYRLMNWDEPLGHAHNYYLNILAESGIIGLLSYLLFWGQSAWLTWRARQHPDPLARAAAIGLLGSWAYLAVHSMLDNLYVNNLFLHIGVMLGILALLYNQTWKTIRIK